MRDFAQALAARYDGTRKNKNKRLLPRVTYFQAWNEPNLSTHLTPQHQGRKYVGASVYRNLLNAFRVGLSAAGRTEASCGGNPSSTDACLVAAGLAPFGNTVSVRDGTGPQDFARAVLCLRYQKVHGRRTLVRIPSCPASSFDAWAQHPYDLIGTPDGEPDYDGHNGLLADLPAIRKIVNTATKLGTAVPAGRKQLWVTEFDWWTNPPNRFYGRSLKTVARWTTDSLFRAWRAGVDVLFWYRSTDVPQWPGGLWLAGANLSPGQISLVSMQKDRAKPELANFRWPMRIAPGRRPYAWGIVRCRQPNVPVRIQKRFHRRWVNTSVATTAASGVFTTRLPAKGHGNGIWRGVAASACGGNSPVWSTKG